LITKLKCSICNEKINEIIDLGQSPPANNFIISNNEKVSSYPLIIDFCSNCYCIQLRDCLSKDELYSYYTYSTPKIESLERHYNTILVKLGKLGFAKHDQSCIEIGSNNGNLLQFLKPYFKDVLGVDPAKNITQIAIKNGINTITDFFSTEVANEIAKSYKKFDVAIARHMFAHNEDPAELLLAMSLILDDKGIFLIENAYALDTFENGEFDQIYHEHMFYFSALNIQALMNRFNFELIDFSHAPVHGGSGIFICGKKGSHVPSESVTEALNREKIAFDKEYIFKNFKEKIESNKIEALKLIKSEVELGHIIGSYGAPAKAFTVFSYYGLDNRTISFCADTTPTKIGKIFPIFNIPIVAESNLKELEYDTLIVNAWNYKGDILNKASSIFKKGTKLIFLIPDLEIHIVE
jgi:SAM-dependent methyltransferase